MAFLARSCARLQWLHKSTRASFGDPLRVRSTDMAISLKPTMSKHFALSTRRSFASTPFQKVRETPQAERVTPPPKSKIPIPDYLPQNVSFTRHLASRPTPTLLYEGTSSNTYPIICYGVSGFSLAYCAWHLYDIFGVDHPGLGNMVRVFMGTTCLVMMGLGLYIGRNAQRLVKSLTAIPTQVKTGRGSGSRSVMLQIEKRKLMPLGQPKRVEVPLEDVSMTTSIAEARAAADASTRAMPTTESGMKRVEMLRRQEEEEDRMRAHQGKRSGKGLSGGVNSLLSSFRRLVSREGLVDLYVGRKQVWRLDVKDAWFLDNGLALERLFKAR